jgi:hypothetical protein
MVDATGTSRTIAIMDKNYKIRNLLMIDVLA